MPQVIQSPEFRQDTDEAWDYFAEENPEYAERFIRKIADKLTLLVGLQTIYVGKKPDRFFRASR